MSAKTAGYAATPHRLGPNNLWAKPGFKLPNYIENVVKGLMESGKSRQDAIPIAIGTVRRWAAGGGNVHPEVVTASKAAIAQWEALKARAKSVKSTHHFTAAPAQRVDLSWDAALHPRVASGTGGGQFTSAQQSAGGKPRDAQAAAAQKNTEAKGQFDQLKNMTPEQRAAFLAKLTPAQRAALTAFAYSAKTSDPKIVAARVALANANAKAKKAPATTVAKKAGAAKKASPHRVTAKKTGATAKKTSAPAKKPTTAAKKTTAPVKKAPAPVKKAPTATKPPVAKSNPPATQKGTPARASTPVALAAESTSPKEAPMARAYAMPVRTELAARVGPRLWRKTILRPGHISKNGVELDVDRRYMEDLIASFRAGAKDQVQFVLANGKNQHDESPERYAGSIVDLAVTNDDRLEATFAVTAKGDQLLTENPELGASPSLEHSFARADGRAGGPTLLHVCGTLDPEISRLGSWARADLSSEYEVLDLTSAELPEPATQTPAAGGSSPSVQQEGRIVPELKTSDEETLAQLRALLPALTKLAAEPENDVTDTEGDVSDDTEVVDEIADEDVEELETPELIAASAEVEALNLANSRLDALEVQNAQLKRRLDEENYLKERDHLAREFQIPPIVTDLCREWLTGSKRVELSAGKHADPGDAIRKALKQFAQVGPLDLSAAKGTGHEVGGAQSQLAEDEAFLTAQHARYGRKES